MPLPAGEIGRMPLPEAQRGSPRGHNPDRDVSSFPSAFSSFAFPKRDTTKTALAPPRPPISSPQRRADIDMQQPGGSEAIMALAGVGSGDNRNNWGSTSYNSIVGGGGGAVPAANANTIPSKFGDAPSPLQSCRIGNSGNNSPSAYSSILKEKRSRVTFTNFYKTKLCPWYLKGNCHWGATCNYAHTLSEQREAVDLTKTKLCSTWLRHGACHNPKCRFAHDYSELRATTDVFKTALCSFYIRKIPCPMEASCRFAHGMHELRSREGPLPGIPRNGGISTLEEIQRGFPCSHQEEQQHNNMYQQRLQHQEEQQQQQHHRHHPVNRRPNLQPPPLHQQQSIQQHQQEQQQHLSGVMAAEARLAAAAAAAAGAAARAAAAAKAASEAKAAAAAAAAAAGMTSSYGAFPYGLGNYNKTLQALQPPPPGFSPISHALHGGRPAATPLPPPQLQQDTAAYENQHRVVEGKTESKASVLEHTVGAKGDSGCLNRPPPHATGILTLDKTTGTWQPAVPSPAYRPLLGSGNGTAMKKGTAQIINEGLRQPGNKQVTETPGYPVDSLESTFDALLQALHQQQRQQQQHQRPTELSDKRTDVPATIPAGRPGDVGKALTMMDFTKLLSTVAMAIATAPVTPAERQQQKQQETAGPGPGDGVSSQDGKRRNEEDIAGGQKYTTEPPTATTTSDDSNAGGIGEQPSWIFSGAAYPTVGGGQQQSGGGGGASIITTHTSPAALTAAPVGGPSVILGESSSTITTAGQAGKAAGEETIPVATQQPFLTADPNDDGNKNTHTNGEDNFNHLEDTPPPGLPAAASAALTPFQRVSSSPSKHPLTAIGTTTPSSAAEKVEVAQRMALPFLSRADGSTPSRSKIENEQDIHRKASPSLHSIEEGTLKPSTSPPSAFLFQDCQSINRTSPAANLTTDRLDAAGTLLVGGGASPAGDETGGPGVAAGTESYSSPAASDRSGHGYKTKAEEAERKGESQKVICWRRLLREEESHEEGTSERNGNETNPTTVHH